MSQWSKHRHGCSSSSPPYRHRRDEEVSFGGEISEEEVDSFTIPPKKVTIEQHRKWRAEGTPLQFQNKQEGKKKEEYVTIQRRKEEEYAKIQVEPDAPQMQGVAARSSFNHSGPMADSESGIMSSAVLVEPDAAQMQGVAAQSSFNHSGPMADSESEIMSYTVLIILLVAEVILGLDFFGVI